MLRLGGVASRTYLVAFPAIKEHFQQQGLELDWVLYSSWDALVEAFVRREVDVAWNGPLAYVKIKRRLGDPCQVVAMRDIAAGEELTIDYALFLADPGFAMDCRCQTAAGRAS